MKRLLNYRLVSYGQPFIMNITASPVLHVSLGLFPVNSNLYLLYQLINKTVEEKQNKTNQFSSNKTILFHY